MEMLVLLALVMATFLFWVRRQGELFHVSIRRGTLLVVRGRVPQGLLADFRPLLTRVQRGSITVQKTSTGGRLSTSQLDEATTQKLRNLLGIRSHAQLLGALPIRNPTLGQRLGITWLAWLTQRR